MIGTGRIPRILGTKTLVQLFEEQVQKTPDKTAAVFPQKALTFSELNRAANRIAYAIRETYQRINNDGIKGDTIIGIYTHRSPEMLTGIYGILKSGGAYLPLDPEEPENRLRNKIEDSGCRLILASSSDRKTLGFLADNIKVMDLLREVLSPHTLMKTPNKSIHPGIWPISSIPPDQPESPRAP